MRRRRLRLRYPGTLNHEGAAHDKWRNQRGEQNHGDHDGNFRLLEDSRAGAHRGDNQPHFTARNHSAANAEAWHWSHTHAKRRHAAADEFADDSDKKDDSKQQPVATQCAKIAR